MQTDLLFKNAAVIDGSGEKAFNADVAVAGDSIEAVGDLGAAPAAKEIDAGGLVLCPGFVDIHGHSDYFILILPSADGKIKQGITTEAIGNCGYSAAPVAGDVATDRRQSHKDLYGLEVDWKDFDDYLARVESARPAINIAAQVGFNTVRGSVGLFSTGAPSREDLDRMRSMVRGALDAGAFGMSLGLIYPPATFAEIGEIVEVAREVSAAGGLVSSHIRSEGDHLIEAIRESVKIAEQAKVQFQVSHLKTSGPNNWGKLEIVFELIEGARDRGVKIFADRYPYLASFTQLSAALPEWVFEGGKDAYFKRIAEREVRERVRKELNKTDSIGDRWDRIVISVAFDDEVSRFEGMSVADAAREAGQDPVDFLCDSLIKCKDRAAATYHTMSIGNLERIIQKDWVMAGTDAAVRTIDGPLSEGKPHPRAYGTMPRMLAWVVKDRGWLSPEQAVRKMTMDPCKTLGIKDRGLVRQGMKADLVLIDLENIKDTATYENPKQYPDGVKMVVVNGKVAVEDGELTGERAGQVLRRG